MFDFQENSLDRIGHRILRWLGIILYDLIASPKTSSSYLILSHLIWYDPIYSSFISYDPVKSDYIPYDEPCWYLILLGVPWVQDSDMFLWRNWYPWRRQGPYPAPASFSTDHTRREHVLSTSISTRGRQHGRAQDTGGNGKSGEKEKKGSENGRVTK